MRRAGALKVISLIMTLSVLLSMNSNNILTAATTVLQPPQRNRVTDIGYVTNTNTSDWYAELAWDAMTFPADADEKLITFGLNEVMHGTGTIQPDAFQVALPGNAAGHDIDEYSPEGIKNGTIYESYVKASYNVNSPTGQYTVTSQKSNPAKFLTGIHVSLELIPGTNNIRIKWDDVWDANGRINYRILISDTKGFTQPPPIPDIVASEIGKSGSAVTVNSAEKKLEYIYTFAMPGREYSIKVIPLPNASVACAEADEISPVTIKTDILLKAQKVGFTNDGDTIWKLFWNPIVKGSTFTRVDYELYRYTNSEPQGQLYRLIPDIDNYQITIEKNDPVLYSFKIDAKAYVLGSDAPIEFRSNNKVVLKEQIPQQPEASDIVDSFLDADPEDLIYDDMLTSSGAVILWRAPYTGEGLIDNDVTYDIYLMEDIKEVSSPPANRRIAADLSMGEANEVRSKLSGAVMGYRYNVEGLKSNATYYFVIYAKKNFLVQSDESSYMITMPYISQQAVKVIITRPDTGTDRPIAPSSPPFGVEPGTDSITYTGASFVMDKQWHALFNETSKRWEYATYDDYIDNLDTSDGEAVKNSMIVNYPAGWTVVPHVVRYNDALNAIRLRNDRDPVSITYSDLSQADIKAFELTQQRVVIPDIDEDEDQTFTFDISGLVHNTAYLAWITIENQNGTSSDPSDPVIITTPPRIPETPVTPTVPTDLKGIASDSFVDLFWTASVDMDYEIKCGTSDVIGSASITREITSEELEKNTFLRIEALLPDTVYYFWIKTISSGSEGQVLESEYSNPLIIKTEAYKPPAPPTGFGIKTGADGVTESSITYLWDAKTGFTYILEFADNASFDNATTSNVTGGAHTVGSLISNRRYYARLYAGEDKTGLRSEPTRTVMVVTNKSKSEYDSSYDLDEALAGDGLNIPTKLINGVWIISSLGGNAHLLGERIRNQYAPIVQIDLSQPPQAAAAIRLELDSAVIEVLSDLKKELYVKLSWGQYIIRPGTFQSDDYFKQRSKNTNLGITIEAASPASQYKPASSMQIKTPVADIKVTYLNQNIPVQELIHPIRVQFPIANLSSYVNGQIKTYGYNTLHSWYALPTYTDYIQGIVAGELDKPGPVVAAAWGVMPKPDVPADVTDSVNRIQSVFDLKSLKGKTFNPKASITQDEIMKLIFDCIPADYNDWDIAQKAVSAGLIKSVNDTGTDFARKDKAVEMLVSLYKFKTRESIVAEKSNIWSYYQDMSKVDARYLNSYRFALENGIINGNGSNLSYPERLMTYGDFMIILERILQLCGEM